MNKVLFELIYVLFFTTRFIGFIFAAFVLLVAASFAFDYLVGRTALL